MGGGRPGDEAPGTVADTSLDSTRVAVFPFTVGGEGELGHLREGMVELLGQSLDGAGRLKVVDPNTLLGRLGERVEGGVGPETARRVAAEFGAGRFVLGRVLRLGDRLRLSGTWYSAGGREIGSAEATGEGEAELQRMVEDLARQAIADLAGGGAEQRQRLAAQTTSSAEALKAYLEGQQAFRARNLQSAMDAFARAVAVDSTFALAHYRLSLSAGWNWELEAMHRHARRAASLSEPLPERDRRLLRAHAAYISGEANRAERQVLAGLEHPNVARLLDGGMTECDLLYLMMKHVDGIPITEYADGQDLGVGARLELLKQVHKAVQVAHRRLVVHRDLKSFLSFHHNCMGAPLLRWILR